jgi:hypothetical protein
MFQELRFIRNPFLGVRGRGSGLDTALSHADCSGFHSGRSSGPDVVGRTFLPGRSGPFVRRGSSRLGASSRLSLFAERQLDRAAVPQSYCPAIASAFTVPGIPAIPLPPLYFAT